MPQYNYKCKDCQTDFFILCGVNDSRENIKCTKCSSLNSVRVFNAKILKGKRAKGYQEEEIKKEEVHECNTSPEHNHTHDHCSPELDYE